MKIEEFVKSYTSEYMFLFHEKKTVKKSTLSKISNFLFEPRYEVNNLKFNVVA